MATSAGSSYEEIPYEGYAFFLTYPDHLAALARLFDLAPADVATCRVLELGCARGDNLLPMAVSLPGAHFTGIDLSPRQIAEGRAAIAELGLANIELREQNIMDLGSELGEFDFILAHGVYSWVPEAVREKLMSICGESLARNGLAFISYNTHPGWHMRTMTRDMMMFAARGQPESGERVRAGRNFMQVVSELLAGHDNAYPQSLRAEAERVVRHDECYLAHEYLEETNEPAYFHRVVDRARSYGLRYLTDAEYWTTAAVRPAELFRAFGLAEDDWLAREQTNDFLKGRAFRNSVFCREDTPCSFKPSAQALLSLRVSSLVRPAHSGRDVGGQVEEVFENLRGETVFATNDRLVITALRLLDEARPRSIAFDTLLTLASERQSAVPEPADASMAPAATLADTFLDLFSHNWIEVHVRESSFATDVGEFPRASPYARRQAAIRSTVANLRHRMVSLIDFDQIVLAHLDGRHDRRLLLAIMADEVKHGRVTISSNGMPITDPGAAEPVLVRLLDETLERLAAGALLIE